MTYDQFHNLIIHIQSNLNIKMAENEGTHVYLDPNGNQIDPDQAHRIPKNNVKYKTICYRTT